MKCPNCQTENREGRKFCGQCGAKLGWKCPGCGFDNEADEKFCGGCGKMFEDAATPSVEQTTPTPKLEDMHARLQSVIPQSLEEKYTAAIQADSRENRPVTALFADISGFTPLSTKLSSEAVFQLVEECFNTLVNIVAGYEGKISGFRGDGLLALFGAPILHENDAERAILAALDMRNAMLEKQLQVSIGINTATMTVGEITTTLHSEYIAHSVEINLAARLQQTAQPGQILVGAGTYRLTRRTFDFQRIEGLSLRGIGEGIVAYEALHVKEHPEKLRGIEGLRARMIGREREFADLKEAADKLLAGEGQMVSIIGEAGIGKSRLVSELKTYLNEKKQTSEV
ncbi:AAA family ATPase, partial [bacterium]|nr:AAA family ATPase [bacterium]